MVATLDKADDLLESLGEYVMTLGDRLLLPFWCFLCRKHAFSCIHLWVKCIIESVVARVALVSNCITKF